MAQQIDPLLDIQTKVLRATFVNNMAVLKKYLPDVYNFYKEYTPTRVKLIFDENGFLNLVSNGSLIYQDDPKKLSDAQVEAFLKDPRNITYHVAKDGSGKFEHERVLGKMVKRRGSEIGYKYQTVLHKNEQIDFIAFMGTGLGYHLQGMFDAHDIRYAFVFEPDPDCFYCTLHSIDIGNMIVGCFERGGQLTLQVGGNAASFVNEIARIFKRQGYFNVAKMYLYRHYFSEQTDEAYQKVHDLAYRYVSGWGFFEDEIISLTHTLSNISTHQFPSILKKAKEVKRDIPIFIVGNGPSLDDNLAFLKDHQGKVIIFSCGTALKPLLDYGITPDFHAETERTAALFEWVDQVGHKEKLKQINLISLNTVYPEILKLFKQAHLILKYDDAGSAFMSQFISDKYAQIAFCNPTVTNTATSAAVAMGFKNMYLFGVDYGYKSEEYHHSKGSLYFDADAEQHRKEMKGDFEVEGNFVEKVHTTQFFDNSRMMLEMLLQANPDVTCVNCSDGAKVQLTQAVKSADLPEFAELIEKSEMTKQMLFDSFDNKDYLMIHPEQKFEALLPEFKKHIETLVSLSKNVKSRVDLAKAFTAQYKFLINFHGDTSKQLFHRFMNGTLTYMQSNIMTNAHLYEDAQQQEKYIKFCLAVMNEHFEWLLEELNNNYNKPSKI
ncbi:motility associated factor glycosyltransferase family protein [Psychromonas ossibalaenae]|uniref:motility associated factor glycosyltransferase family protein n=1 Tax=Psychromonas ossibalaenae TaxID=444922 RepID=UPI00037CC462|nr:6-hydroxymethylpterin diphosphokinase MptE-like protein [Psychromonas ossibalaenae]